MTAPADAETRLRTYQRLTARNRIVAILRIGVPAIGIVVLVGLVGQIYLSSLGARFGIGQITVTGEAVNVDAPEYAGVLDDGSRYHVSATSAQAKLEATDLIALTDAALTVIRTNGVTTEAKADVAQLDTTRELVIIPGRARVTESTGTIGLLDDSVFDWHEQTLTTKGPVVVDYADGAHLVAKGLVYHSKSMTWTFSGATVTLPETPGAKTP
jgi:lipopolysaccharide export system protein LptC